MKKTMGKVLCLALALILVLSAPLPAIAVVEYDDFEGYGSDLYNSGDVGILDAIILNLGEYALKIGETQLPPTDLESYMEDQAVEDMSKTCPVIKDVKLVYDVFKASAYAFSDLGKAISNAYFKVQKQLGSAQDMTEQAMSTITVKQTVAYELGKKDRNTNNSVPTGDINALSVNNIANNAVKELKTQADSWYIKLFAKSTRSKLLAMAGALENQVKYSHSPQEWYNLGRYGNMEGARTQSNNAGSNSANNSSNTTPSNGSNNGANANEGNTAAQAIADGIYTFTLKSGGKALNLYAETAAKSNYNGCNVTVWKVTGHSTQSFKISGIGNGMYKITSVANNRVIDVKRNDNKKGRPIEIGGNIDIWENDDPAAQQWYIKEKGSYWYIELASKSGAVIGCVAPSKDGGNVVLQTYNGSDSQLWKLNKQ